MTRRPRLPSVARRAVAIQIHPLAIALPLVTLALVAACGSGSSGFDPQVAEQEAILDSATARACRRGPGGIELCATGAPLTLPFEGTPGASPSESPVDGIEAGAAVTCSAPTGACSLRIVLQEEPFAPGTLLLAAIRPEQYDEPWRTSIAALTPPADRVLVPTFVSELPVGTPIVTAVLVFPPGTSVPAVAPDGIDADLLADLGAPRAGIVLGLTIPTPDSPPPAERR